MAKPCDSIFKFRNDLKSSELAVTFVQQLLNEAGAYCLRNETTKLSGWDLEFDDNGEARFIEIKWDKMAAKTGNMAIEFFNSRKNTAAGLLVTVSHLWVVVLGAKVPEEAWVANVADLKTFFNATSPLRTIEHAGDGNASIALYPMTQVLPAAFVRFDNLGESDLKSLLVKKCSSRPKSK